MKFFTIIILLLWGCLSHTTASNLQPPKNSTDTLVTISAAITGYYVKNNSYYINVHLVIRNHSPKKLLYHVCRCSGDNNYSIDSKVLKISAPTCFDNTPSDNYLLPDSIHTANITLTTPISLYELRREKFRVGFYVVETYAYGQTDLTGAFLSDLNTPNVDNEVWSGFLQIE